MLFAAKVAAARAAAALSRRAGAGGGTALPGKLLLRAAPEALGRLAAALPDGTALVSATNGKTTSAKMAAAMLEPEVPLCANRAGANLASGVASALLHCRGARMGLFESTRRRFPGSRRHSGRGSSRSGTCSATSSTATASSSCSAPAGARRWTCCRRRRGSW
jgi:hypothetical protein